MNTTPRGEDARSRRFVASLLGVALGLATLLAAQGGEQPKAPRKAASPEAGEPEGAAPKESPIPLNKNGTVLLDKPGRRLLLKTEVVLREGLLEQFCCLKQTKEHESILSLDGRAHTVHAGLLALGAKVGSPVRYTPEYKAPTGQRIEIFVSWTDEKGKLRRVPAQSWVRKATQRFWGVKLEALPAGLKLPENSELRYEEKLKELSWYGPMTLRQKEQFLALSTDKAYRSAIAHFFEQGQSHEMKADFVFAGSGFYKDEETKQEYYLAEDGDFICVANFPGATIDVSVPSSPEGEGVLFEAYTERIPPRETPVTVELIPVFEKEEKKEKK
jgi:hypothetical protein